MILLLRSKSSGWTLRGFVTWIRSTFRPRGFHLTVEQSVRARQILTLPNTSATQIIRVPKDIPPRKERKMGVSIFGSRWRSNFNGQSVLLIVLGTAACSKSGGVGSGATPNPTTPDVPSAETAPNSGPAALDGVWVGVSPAGMRTVLSLNSSKRTLDFGVPRQCSLELEDPVGDATQYTLGVRRSDGGYCDKLLDGTVVVKGEARLRNISCTLKTRDSQTIESIELHR